MKAKKNSNTLGNFLTIEEVTQILNVSKGTIYNLINTGKIKKYKLTAKSTRLKASEIIDYIDSRAC
ncbi:MAG: helix-turn-helix transcriptional regulator [Salinivirgaceae bacterium]